ncbi:hypothetical protein H2200_009126 [Cladophialophora chaetospira]|uniref:C2H2-type domain-containing protein n=1 Tax=Cladophialophora chaetospira TaxID=386627 RepID=A0AA38X3M3_9EURO|nr:hypothetical protein H2200_009126 [Cladophialophora chaetospira]
MVLDESDTDGEASSTTENEGPSDGAQAERTVEAHCLRPVISYVDLLMDLCPTLEQTYNDMHKGSSRRPQGLLHDAISVTPAALPYINNVKDKFPRAVQELVRRLGEANWQRHERLRSIQAHGPSSEPVIIRDAKSLFRPVSQFQDSALGSSIRTQSQRAESNASHSSFVSSTADQEKGHFRVPPLPKGASYEETFVCPYCCGAVSKIKNRIDWKLHVFGDLNAYICTSGSCSLVTFPSRKSWYEHEKTAHLTIRSLQCQLCVKTFENSDDFLRHADSAHGMTLDTVNLKTAALSVATVSRLKQVETLICPLCLEGGWFKHREYSTHLGRHLEEIALAALPPGNDDEEDADSDMEVLSEISHEDEHIARPNNYMAHSMEDYEHQIVQPNNSAPLGTHAPSMHEREISAVPMSPQSSQGGWASTTSPDTAEPGRTFGQGYRGASRMSVMRSEDIKKKNIKFNIPAERNINNIDTLIAHTSDKEEKEELKQQKRLLLNRQAALDSRMRKKQNAEKVRENMLAAQTAEEAETLAAECSICGMRFQDPDTFGEHMQTKHPPLDRKDLEHLRQSQDFRPKLNNSNQEEEEVQHRLSAVPATSTKPEIGETWMDRFDPRTQGSPNGHRVHRHSNSIHVATRAGTAVQPSTPGQKHKCPHCDLEFTRHHNLKSHLLTHSQEKPYVCSTCSARFRRLNNLKRHTKLHTGERSHSCPACGRKFSRAAALARHSEGPGGCAGRRATLGSDNEEGLDHRDIALKDPPYALPSQEPIFQTEEQYTIKCICEFADDDGNTVCCPKCDTWQHIICYYPENQQMPDEHCCDDCFPCGLDKTKATERQRSRREFLEAEHRENKRPRSIKAGEEKQRNMQRLEELVEVATKSNIATQELSAAFNHAKDALRSTNPNSPIKPSSYSSRSREAWLRADEFLQHESDEPGNASESVAGTLRALKDYDQVDSDREADSVSALAEASKQASPKKQFTTRPAPREQGRGLKLKPSHGYEEDDEERSSVLQSLASPDTRVEERKPVTTDTSSPTQEISANDSSCQWRDSVQEQSGELDIRAEDTAKDDKALANLQKTLKSIQEERASNEATGRRRITRSSDRY